MIHPGDETVELPISNRVGDALLEGGNDEQDQNDHRQGCGAIADELHKIPFWSASTFVEYEKERLHPADLMGLQSWHAGAL